MSQATLPDEPETPLEPFSAHETALLRTSLALEDEELAFLAAAAMPHRLAAAAGVQRQRAVHAQTLGLVLALGALALAYVGWLVVSPRLWDVTATARRLGVTTILANALVRCVVGLLETLISAVETASRLPGFDQPLSALALVAVALWAGLIVAQRRVGAGPLTHALTLRA